VFVYLKPELSAYYSGNIAQGVCKETLAVNETEYYSFIFMVYLTTLSVPSTTRITRKDRILGKHKLGGMWEEVIAA
jgi:hypothetical protein